MKLFSLFASLSLVSTSFFASVSHAGNLNCGGTVGENVSVIITAKIVNRPDAVTRLLGTQITRVNHIWTHNQYSPAGTFQKSSTPVSQTLPNFNQATAAGVFDRSYPLSADQNCEHYSLLTNSAKIVDTNLFTIPALLVGSGCRGAQASVSVELSCQNIVPGPKNEDY